MFKRNESGAATGGETVIAQGVKVEGDFTSKGDVVIEGEVAGSVSVDGDLKVGQSARIAADVTAKNAVVAGEVQGNLNVAETLDLTASAKVVGDISATILTVASGSTINGRVSMGQSQKKKTEVGE